MDTSAYYSARPRLRLDGEDVPALSDGVITMLIHENVEGLYSCELTVGNWGNTGNGLDHLYFDRQVIDFGRELEVVAGDGDAEKTLFKGSITAIEARFPQSRPAEMAVLAEDRFQDLRMTRRTRSFEEVSDADVAGTIASDHGLRADVDADGPTWPVLAQVNQSDLAFLRERARAVDAEVWIEDGVLHMQARARREADTLTLTYGQRLREFSVLADLAGQATGFTVAGWDVSAKETVEVSADRAAISSELDGGDAGADILAEAFGDRDQRIVHQLPGGEAEARALAEAHFRRGARAFVRGAGIAEGDGRLRVGARVELKGLGPLFEGEYQIIETRHMFEATSGLTTAFRVERPNLGRP